jgi:hypothetical protein
MHEELCASPFIRAVMVITFDAFNLVENAGI